MVIIIDTRRKIKRFRRVFYRFYVLNNAFTGSLDKLPIEKKEKIRYDTDRKEKHIKEIKKE